jgi:hypothetical protein
LPLNERENGSGGGSKMGAIKIPQIISFKPESSREQEKIGITP